MPNIPQNITWVVSGNWQYLSNLRAPPLFCFSFLWEVLPWHVKIILGVPKWKNVWEHWPTL